MIPFMPQRGGMPMAPPASWSPWWGRIGALALMALVFWADALTPPGIAVPALYVLPVLLFMLGGAYWEPLLVAIGATLLIAAGTYATPPGGSVAIAMYNRPLSRGDASNPTSACCSAIVLLARSVAPTSSARLSAT